MMSMNLLLVVSYILFLFWHDEYFKSPLSKQEVDEVLSGLKQDVHEVSSEDRANFRKFLYADDGKPFYMLNLMKVAPKSRELYSHPVEAGRP